MASSHTIGRHPDDLGRSLIAAAVFAGCAVLAAGGTASRLETDVFQVFNNLPGWAALVLLPILQIGSAIAIAVASGVALFAARIRLGLKLAVGGGVAWGLAHLIAEVVGRSAPLILLDRVTTRGGAFLDPSFPSSHVAVAAAMAILAAPYIPARHRKWLWWVVGAVAAAAMFAGRALPLDVIAGAALGWWEGALIHALWGAPGRKTSPQLLHRVLEDAGFEPTEIHHSGGRPWTAAEFTIVTATGNELIATVDRHPRSSSGATYKVRRFIASIEALDEAEFATTKHEAEHEAYVSLLAERAGVRTPRVVVARELPGGAAVLVRERVHGVMLRDAPDEQITDAVLEDAWMQVAQLRDGRIAHHDLTPDRLVLDDKDQVWIVDFRMARAGAGRARLDQDTAEMLICLSAAAGVERAVRAGMKVLGPTALEAALLYLQPLALPARVRRTVRGVPGLLGSVRAEVADRTGATPPTFKARIRPSTILSLAVLGGAIYILLPQIGNVSELVQAVLAAQWWWLVLATIAGAITFPAAAWSYMGAVEKDLPPLRTTAIQLASAFTSRLTPAGIGGLGLNAIYFERSGVPRRNALGAVGLSHAAGAVVHAVGVFGALWFIGSSGIGGVEVPSGWPILVAIVAGLAVAGILLGSPFGRRKIVRPGLDLGRRLIGVVRQPRRALALFGGSAAVTLANGFALAACLAAFTTDFSLVKVLAVYIGGSAVASPSPTPGALGAVEAALVAGLTGIGVPATPAVAAVLTFRLLSFWLPILPGLAVFRYLQHRKIV